MARTGRIGSLSPKTYFPRTGDQLVFDNGILAVCAKANSVTNPFTNGDVRYGLMCISREVYGEEGEWLPIDDVVSETGEMEWIRELEAAADSGLVSIRRRLPAGDRVDGKECREYKKNDATGTWQQDKKGE